ncbi:hypothetical protein Tco_0210481 [Tanacetum coccineum]
MLMRSDELYKFSDRTLTGLRTSLDDITKNIQMEYLQKRIWSTLEKKRANIMIKAIDKQLKEKRPHGRMILASVEKGLLVWPSITVDGVTRLKEYTKLTPAEAIQADCDIKAINIILQGLPTEIYALQERECKLYDEFDKFTYKKGESLHEYYLRFTLLLNDMNIYKMPLEQFQVNTKFLNTLPDEWSKFITDVKLVKDLHTTDKCMDKSKITRKQSKASKHGHENQKSTKRSQRSKAEARKVKPQSNPKNYITKPSHWPIPIKEAHVDFEEAQWNVGFCTKILTKEAQTSHQWNDTLAILRCPQLDQTATNEAQMIGEMIGQD